jgi:hypothetical protein
MRYLLVLISLIVVCALGLQAQRRVPPGQRQADAVEDTMTKLEPPMVAAQAGITPAQLAREGAELSELAGLVQKQIELVNQGRFPNDLPKNLKQIEKLAHKINLQISR